jgi:hypothetical protein
VDICTQNHCQHPNICIINQDIARVGKKRMNIIVAVDVEAHSVVM